MYGSTIFLYKLKINSYTGLMADRDFEISDDLPNLDELIFEGEIELLSSRLLSEVPRPKSENVPSGQGSNLHKGFPPNGKQK
jgi:hypothetical protein